MNLILTQDLHKGKRLRQRSEDGGRGCYTARNPCENIEWPKPGTQNVDRYLAGDQMYRLELVTPQTLHKVQGATPHIKLWLDVPGIEAAGYVALSRVERDTDWRYIGELTPNHFVQMSGVPSYLTTF